MYWPGCIETLKLFFLINSPMDFNSSEKYSGQLNVFILWLPKGIIFELILKSFIPSLLLNSNILYRSNKLWDIVVLSSSSLYEFNANFLVVFNDVDKGVHAYPIFNLSPRCYFSSKISVCYLLKEYKGKAYYY